MQRRSNKIWQQFYFRPKNILKVLLWIMSFWQVNELMTGFWQVPEVGNINICYMLPAPLAPFWLLNLSLWIIYIYIIYRFWCFLQRGTLCVVALCAVLLFCVAFVGRLDFPWLPLWPLPSFTATWEWSFIVRLQPSDILTPNRWF